MLSIILNVETSDTKREESEENGTISVTVCIFRVGSQLYCLRTDVVEYVYPYCEITPLPHAAASIEGAVSLHGSILPVVDMGTKCNEKALEQNPAHKLIVLAVGERRLALHIEEIMDVVELGKDKIDKSEAILPGLQMLHGIVKYHDGLAVLYAPERFFEAELAERFQKE